MTNPKPLAPVDPNKDPFITVPYLSMIDLACVKHVEPWMEVAVAKATGGTDLYHQVLFSIVWNMTASKDGSKPDSIPYKRKWLAMLMGFKREDAITPRVHALVDAGLLVLEGKRLSINRKSPAIRYAAMWQAGQRKEVA